MYELLPTRKPSIFAPWREFDGFENRIRQLLGETFGPTDVRAWAPVVDVVETDEEIRLTAELPGVEPADVNIDVQDQVLTIRGEKKHEKDWEEKKAEGKVRVWERAYGEFCRTFTLPATVQAEKIAAEFKDGVLMIHLPKTPQAKGRRIKVEAK